MKQCAWANPFLLLADVAILAFPGDLHKSNAARKDAELQELRRVVAAKERSIDSLRTQLATAKGSLEAYTQESEAILQQRDGEVQDVPQPAHRCCSAFAYHCCAAL